MREWVERVAMMGSDGGNPAGRRRVLAFRVKQAEMPADNA